MYTNTNKDFWDRYARLYAPMMQSGKLYRELCMRISSHLKPDMDVLELACGSGQLSFPLSGKVHLWEATDFSRAMILEAKKTAGPTQLHFSVKDATHLPYADESFDAVVIANALHIMPEPEKALHEIYRVLKKDGILFAPTFIHGKSAGARLRIHLMELAGFKVFHHWEPEEFSDFISSQLFKIDDCKIIGSSLAPLCYLSARKD